MTGAPAIELLWSKLTDKMLVLAEDIAKNGLSPIDNFYVAPIPEHPGEYVVLEGNRRTAALQALHAPDSVGHVLSNAQLKRLKKAAKGKIPESVTAAVAGEEDDIALWLQRRHLGEDDGRGTVTWGPLARLVFFNDTLNMPQPSLRLLRWVVNDFPGSHEDRERLRTTVPFTTWARVVDDTGASTMLGVRDASQLPNSPKNAFYDKPEVIRPLWERVLLNLVGEAGDQLDSRSLNSSKEIHDNISALVQDILPEPAKRNSAWLMATGEATTASGNSARGGELSSSATPATGGGTSNAGPTSKGRGSKRSSEKDDKGKTGTPTGRSKSTKKTRRSGAYLVKPNEAFPNANARVHEIFTELTKLSLNTTPNTVGVMLRVLVELSLDAFGAAYAAELYPGELSNVTSEKRDHKVAGLISRWQSREKLSNKLDRTGQWLAQNNWIDANALRSVRRLANGPGASVWRMHQFVHGSDTYPTQDELRSLWAEIRPILAKIWALDAMKQETR